VVHHVLRKPRQKRRMVVLCMMLGQTSLQCQCNAPGCTLHYGLAVSQSPTAVDQVYFG
jgi:hypothetical protein